MSTKHRNLDEWVPVLLPSYLLERLESLRDESSAESVAAVIAKATELLAGRRSGRETAKYEELTRRHREVLRLIADGHSTKEIAARLHISKKTVEFHRRALARQLGIRSIALLARFAVRAGAVSA